VGGEYANVHLANEVGDSVTDLGDIHETKTDRPRILRASVAQQYAQNSLQFPRHSLATGNITFLDRVPHWSYALRPVGVVNTFIGNQAGAVFVDLTTEGKRVSVTEREFDCGPGPLVTDHYQWQLHKSRDTVEYQDPCVIPTGDDGLVVAVPYVSHEHQFRATPVPQLYSVPRFGGLALVDESREITHLSSEEARSYAVLADQRFYPYDLAFREVNAMQYQNGMLGPRKAANYVEQDNPRVNWNGMSPSEPLSVVRNGTLWWEVRVVPDSSAGVTDTAFVNADTGDVIRYVRDDDVADSIAGRGPIDGTDGGGPPSDGDGDGFVVVVVDENGDVVRRIEVGGNQRVRIERSSNGTVTPS